MKPGTLFIDDEAKTPRCLYAIYLYSTCGRARGEYGDEVFVYLAGDGALFMSCDYSKLLCFSDVLEP